MKSLPSIVIAGSGLSPLAARLSLTLLLLLPLPLPFSTGEYSILHPDLTALVSPVRACPPAGRVVAQPGGIRPWPFPFHWKQRMQTCSLLHKYSKCYCGFFYGIFFFFFLFSLQWLEIANAQEKKEDCRGTPFPWASCRTHVQEIECKNYCMRGC